MAHGIIPPFSNFLITRDLILKLSSDGIPKDDLVLLGNAANEVQVPLEIAEDYYGILNQIRYYLGASLFDVSALFDDPCTIEQRRLLGLLIAYVLDVSGSEEILELLLPLLKDESHTWMTLINGPLDSRIQSVENDLGYLIKIGAKDIVTQKPLQGGYENLERMINNVN
ncbi:MULTISPECIES: hypothetical protein [unclassified Adlercreutzia]|uniref:hypothetical protein n=1 Tax=unclassified Adlercreutzia TaxID=2636013 RepID=UPI0013EA95C5|nr:MULTISPECIES: hypothetical protein [unclassified Adlercreutzia]